MRKVKVRLSDGEVQTMVLDVVKTVKGIRAVVGETNSSATIGGIVVDDDRELVDGDNIVFSPKTNKQG